MSFYLLLQCVGLLVIRCAVYLIALKMEWSRIAVECLNDTYNEETRLYNTKSPNYHNKHARREALERISAALENIGPHLPMIL